MASPWKFLTRLVLPRRQQRPENGSIDDVKADSLANAKPKTRAKDELNTADPPVDEKPVAHGRSEGVSAEPDRSDVTASGVAGVTDIVGATFLKAADPTLSDDANTVRRAARRHPRTGGAPTRKRNKPGKTAETIDTDPPLSKTAVSGDAVSLNEEIRLLRDQLARKLQLQNAQLKRMLERFER